VTLGWPSPGRCSGSIRTRTGAWNRRFHRQPVPAVGHAVVDLMLGGPIIAGATLSRFFALHVFVIPGLLIAFVAVHLLLVLKLGINEWPMPGRLVRCATYVQEYQQLAHEDGVPFVPNAVGKDIVFSGIVLVAVAACAFFIGPFGPGGQPDPTIIQVAPRPDFFFLWLYATLSYLPPSYETPVLLIGPALVVLGLIAVPFLAERARRAGSADRSRHGGHSRRGRVGVPDAPRSSHAVESEMDAWSGQPIPDKYLEHRTALAAPGSVGLPAQAMPQLPCAGRQRRQAWPPLDAVAVRLTRDQLIRQVIQGGGNMPAYGKNLSPPETTALVAYLETLRPKGEAPAQNASNAAARGSGP